MIQPTSQTFELEIGNLLQKNVKLDEFINQIKNQLSDKILVALEFHHFSILNELFTETKSLFILMASLKLAFEGNLNNYLIEFSNVPKNLKTHIFKFVVHAFFSDVKLTQYLHLDPDALKSQIEKNYANKRIVDIDRQITSEITKLIPSGPSVPCKLFMFDSSTHQYFDNPEFSSDLLKCYRILSENAGLSDEFDFLLPLPSEVEPTFHDFLTPFPIFLDAPMLNPELPQNAIMAQILKNSSRASESEVNVF